MGNADKYNKWQLKNTHNCAPLDTNKCLLHIILFNLPTINCAEQANFQITGMIGRRSPDRVGFLFPSIPSYHFVPIVRHSLAHCIHDVKHKCLVSHCGAYGRNVRDNKAEQEELMPRLECFLRTFIVHFIVVVAKRSFIIAYMQTSQCKNKRWQKNQAQWTKTCGRHRDSGNKPMRRSTRRA